jgi:serine/threonine protein phosphatase 1
VPSPLPGIQRLSVRGRPPSLPAGVRIYSVGDIHGRLDLLNTLLSRIHTDLERRPTGKALYVFLGDYIDRGPSSRDTIDRLIEHGKRSDSRFLKGNHEVIAIRCLSDRSLIDQWMRLGGLETLISYGVGPEILANGKQFAELQTAFHDALPQSHLRFLGGLQSSFSYGDFFFAHAGVKPGVELSRQKDSDLLWIRDDFLCSNVDFGKIVVHGHTPTHEIEVASNRINIDTGAFATGRLTSLVIEESSISVIDTA